MPSRPPVQLPHKLCDWFKWGAEQRTCVAAQLYKITLGELKVGSITDAILCRIAASHC